MKSKQIVLTLGYIAIFCVALYFVFGLLQISGRGLTGMIGGPMIEGMTDKQREKAEKDIEEVNIKLEKDLEGLKEGLGKAFLNADQIDGFDRFQENLITITNYSLDIILAHSTVQYFIDLNYFEKVVNLCYQKLKKGGKLVAMGTPEEVARIKTSYTGQYLSKKLKN